MRGRRWTLVVGILLIIAGALWFLRSEGGRRFLPSWLTGLFSSTQGSPSPSPAPSLELPGGISSNGMPPAVDLHRELLPAGIDINGVRYGQGTGKPGSNIDFDINGSGFTDSFKKMIQVESGNPDVSVKDLRLAGQNKLSGTLAVGAAAANGSYYPRVLINGKVVYQAGDPFGVNGSGQNGFGQTGVGQNGSGQAGRGQNGLGQNGSGLPGTGLNGSGQAGRGQNGLGQNGSGLSGTGQKRLGQAGGDAQSKREPKKPAKPVVVSPTTMQAPPVELHKELIPKNIEIVRIYYAQGLTGPGSTIDFDINGSGFTKEFEQMIKVESGHPDVTVTNLRLVTPNQIGGQLVVADKTPTGVVFPRVLIQGKVVFQAGEPFGVIRPGEVLSLMFTEMGENGRTGRFRIFTNLTEEMFKAFSIVPSTTGIQIGDLRPSLPFVVDAAIFIGAAPGGDYAVIIKLGEKVIWQRDGVIRIVRPNIGDSGLIQRVNAVDGFHRPGDKALFVIQGSGFQPRDADLLKVSVPGFDIVKSTIVYVAPGRLDLTITIPAEAPEKNYSFSIMNGDQKISDVPNAFRIVGKNWTRSLEVNPNVGPGETSTLVLAGRDLDSDFVKQIKVDVDEPELKIGVFTWMSPEKATADIAIGASVAPGDYWIKLTSGGGTITPAFGSIIRVGEKK